MSGPRRSRARRAEAQDEPGSAEPRPSKYKVPRRSKAKGRQITLPPSSSRSGRNLLQVAHRRQIKGQLGDTRRAAPVGSDASRVDRSNIRRAGAVEGTGEGVAVTLVQVGVGVAQIEGEHLVGEADADIPGVVVG